MVNQVVINPDTCKSCGYCIYFCPRKTVLKQGEQVNKKGYRFTVVKDTTDCTACGICATVCPEISITVVKDI